MIQTILQEKLPTATIYVDNPRCDDVHFEAIVISPEFESLSLLKQHQKVMNILKAHFGDNRIHALALKTFSPQNWEKSELKNRLENR